MLTNQKIATDLHSASIRLLRWLRREDDAEALPAAQLSALSVIVYKPGISASALAREEQVAAPSMTRTVDALVRAGLTQRISDPDDRRRVAIQATSKGRDLLRASAARRIARLSERLSRMPAEDLAILSKAAPLLLALTHSD